MLDNYIKSCWECSVKPNQRIIDKLKKNNDTINIADIWNSINQYETEVENND